MFTQVIHIFVENKCCYKHLMNKVEALLATAYHISTCACTLLYYLIFYVLFHTFNSAFGVETCEWRDR